MAIDYSLKLDSGEEVDKSSPGKPMGFVFSAGQVIPGLEKELAGKEQGWSTQFTVEAEDGYGQPRNDLVRQIPRERLPSDVDVKPGMAFQAEGPEGTIPFMVKAVDGDSVTIDLNHPLCGERLHFDIKIVEVRDATEEELAAI